jgi:hypothetical protein
MSSLPNTFRYSVPAKLPEGDMVGSLQTKPWVKLGLASSHAASTMIERLLLIVLSVHAPTAEIVLATKDWAQSGEIADGKLWRYLNGTVSGRSLEFNFLRSCGSVHERPHTFKWKDAVSGTHHYFMQSVPFTRLDWDCVRSFGAVAARIDVSRVR